MDFGFAKCGAKITHGIYDFFLNGKVFDTRLLFDNCTRRTNNRALTTKRAIRFFEWQSKLRRNNSIKSATGKIRPNAVLPIASSQTLTQSPQECHLSTFSYYESEDLFSLFLLCFVPLNFSGLTSYLYILYKLTIKENHGNRIQGIASPRLWPAPR